jgi:endonuclease/exonuclease/phosphatase (EEP) superfamily protein YafD
VFDGFTGLAVYSKFPITTQFNDPNINQPFQSVLLNVNGSRVHVINAHLARTGMLYFLITGNAEKMRIGATARRDQIFQIKNVIGQAGFPAIVACDCNMTELTAAYQYMTSDLLDSYRQQGWGLGHTFLIPRGFEFPSNANLPFQRIDYFFNSPEIGITWITLLYGETGSDHRPLLAQFEIKP